MSEEPEPEWKWTETPEFAQDCEALHEDPGEVDYIRGIIGDTIVANPVAASRAFFEDALPEIPGMTADVRYFRTLAAPGLSDLPPKVVIFQLEPDPTSGPREITGLALFDDDEA